MRQEGYFAYIFHYFASVISKISLHLCKESCDIAVEQIHGQQVQIP